jgi:uncharacterized protein YdeI (YjbR/CyaY-like superfamily)
MGTRGTSRQVQVPDDLRKAVDANRDAREAWERFPPSHRKRYVEWLAEAKKPETRRRRLAQAVEMIAQKRPD